MKKISSMFFMVIMVSTLSAMENKVIDDFEKRRAEGIGLHDQFTKERLFCMAYIQKNVLPHIQEVTKSKQKLRATHMDTKEKGCASNKSFELDKLMLCERFTQSPSWKSDTEQEVKPNDRETQSSLSLDFDQEVGQRSRAREERLWGSSSASGNFWGYIN